MTENQNQDQVPKLGEDQADGTSNVAVTEAAFQLGQAAIDGLTAVASGAGECVKAVCECIGDIASGM